MVVTTIPTMKNAWGCRIGGLISPLPAAADAPLRHAVEAAYFRVVGRDADFCYSGWGNKLGPSEGLKLAAIEVMRLRSAGILDEVISLAQADKLLGIE